MIVSYNFSQELCLRITKLLFLLLAEKMLILLASAKKQMNDIRGVNNTFGYFTYKDLRIGYYPSLVRLAIVLTVRTNTLYIEDR